MRIPRLAQFLLTAALLAAVGCGDSDDPSTMGDGGMLVDGGGCAPDEIEAPNGKCFKRIACPSSIPTFKLGLEAAGDEGLYKAVIYDAMPSSPRQFVNRWVVDIVDNDDTPVGDITLDEVIPFMPAHAHGALRDPVIEALDDPGRFDVDIINLWMPGPWTVTFEVTGPDGSDSIVFDVCI